MTLQPPESLQAQLRALLAHALELADEVDPMVAIHVSTALDVLAETEARDDAA